MSTSLKEIQHSTVLCMRIESLLSLLSSSAAGAPVVPLKLKNVSCATAALVGEDKALAGDPGVEHLDRSTYEKCLVHRERELGVVDSEIIE